MGNHQRIKLLAGMLLLGFSVYAQTERHIQEMGTDLLQAFPTSMTVPGGSCRIERVNIDQQSRTIRIVGNDFFEAQPFTEQKVRMIYQAFRKLLDRPYRSYKLIISGPNYPIEDLVPNAFSRNENEGKRWQHDNRGMAPWVTQTDKPYNINKGLQGRHIALWASHGRFFKQEKNRWQWQRPNLFCTNEDLLTQTIVVPYLMPMLENAGAVVFSPRERSWQKHEVIVDNDIPSQNGRYQEHDKKYDWENAGWGFAQRKTVYTDGENPFLDGSARAIPTVQKASQASTCSWMPLIPEKGKYAVYVSYSPQENAVDDARYCVTHQGQRTFFSVNQKMGAGTWVYLGTFEFDAGCNARNAVTLSNYSENKGTVSADAVRFGGGMGNIARGNNGFATTSGMPRFLEGARYYAQWAGMPYAVYSSKQGSNDYADDINVRSYMTNYLAGGSVFLPSDTGLHVPIELSLAVHSDAGYRADNSYVGTLGIYTTQTDGGFFPEGMSRLASRDLCDVVITQVHQDMTRTLGHWNRRQMFDRNYSETRVPQIPAMILETLSHQNFQDMKRAHDPYFKFLLARSIYKGVLKFITDQHHTDAVVQPLPVSDFATTIQPEKERIRLSWTPTADPLEPDAQASGYVVYMRRGEEGYDNGTFVKNTHLEIEAEPNTLYTFRVCAVNSGGASLPSEELCAYIADKSRASVMIVNGFQRLAGPQPIQTPVQTGFDLNQDPGIYAYAFPGYCGPQINYDTHKGGHEGPDGLGYSNTQLEGLLIAGNTFDYPTQHGKSIQACGRYSFASCSRDAVEKGRINLNDYHVVDLILGLQKEDGYSMKHYKTFTPALQNALKEYVRMKGNLLVSGAFIGTDMLGINEQGFTQNILKFKTAGRVRSQQIQTLNGMNISCSIWNQFNEKSYHTTWVDCIQPTSESFSMMLYNNQVSAGVAYAGQDYRCMALGFPFENIREEHIRHKMMAGILNFLLAK